MSALVLEALSKAYPVREASLPELFLGRTSRIPRRAALLDLSLKLVEPTALGIVGSNGAGKSTLIKILAGILRPDQGKVELFGRTPHSELNPDEVVALGAAVYERHIVLAHGDGAVDDAVSSEAEASVAPSRVLVVEAPQAVRAAHTRAMAERQEERITGGVDRGYYPKPGGLRAWRDLRGAACDVTDGPCEGASCVRRWRRRARWRGSSPRCAR